MSRDRRRSEKHGRIAETAVAWWLRLKGWRILDRRVRTPVGEVDLVARKGALDAFVEVKARATAAEYLAPRYAGPTDDIRIDVVLIARGRTLRHIENAWIG